MCVGRVNVMVHFLRGASASAIFKVLILPTPPARSVATEFVAFAARMMRKKRNKSFCYCYAFSHVIHMSRMFLRRMSCVLGRLCVRAEVRLNKRCSSLHSRARQKYIRCKRIRERNNEHENIHVRFRLSCRYTCKFYNEFRRSSEAKAEI